MQNMDSQWAIRLGLAANPLFGSGSDMAVEGSHVALLDGVAGSFALSTGFDSRQRDAELSNWAWSASLKHHVTVSSDTVELRSALAYASVETFSLSSVERNLEGFLRFLETRSEVPRIDVIDHVASVFRKHCHMMSGRSTAVGGMFLALIAIGLEHGLDQLPDAARVVHDVASRFALSAESVEAVTEASPDYLNRVADELQFCALETQQLNLDLAIRHASGPIFQDAHAALSVLPSDIQSTLFGLSVTSPRVGAYGKGVFFTPVGLARSIADFVVSGLMSQPRETVVVADIACGSGIFLTEALRALRRHSFSGHVRVIGMDISQDAVAMARFNLACATRDVSDANFTVNAEVQCGDFFDAEMPWTDIDAVLMNPPYISWEGMQPSQQQRVKDVLGPAYKGRPDYSTAFLARVVERLKPSGWVAALLPTGVLAGEHSAKWRDLLLEQATPKFVAMLGDHSLFRGALVNPGIVVMQKHPSASGPVTQLWSSERKDAASAALRELRRVGSTSTLSVAKGDGWSLYPVDTGEFHAKSNWLPSPSATGARLAEIRASVSTIVSDLFAIKQGVRTGLREAFILPSEDWESLPAGEKVHFRRVVDGRNIAGGRIMSDSYILWPNVNFSGTQEAVRELLPVFYDRFFERHLEQLRTRKKVSPETPGKLTWERTWLRTDSPRIVSKMFARGFGFACDLEGEFIVVQGLAWLPKAKLIHAFGSDVRSIREALTLYVAILNSEIFFRLVQYFSTNVAGGQLDLAAKFLDNVPLPDLSVRLAESTELNDMARQLVAVAPSDSNYRYVTQINLFAALAYKVNANDWLGDA